MDRGHDNGVSVSEMAAGAVLEAKHSVEELSVGEHDALESIQNLRAYIAKAFAEKDHDSRQENCTYGHQFSCVLFPKKLMVEQKVSREGTNGLVVETLEKLLPNFNHEVVHAYLPARSSWYHVGVSNAEEVLEKLAKKGVRRCLHFSCSGHVVPFKMTEYIRVDGIPASVVERFEPKDRVSAVRNLVVQDVEAFCMNSGFEQYRGAFRVHTPRFFRGGGPGGSYSVGILAPCLSVAQAVRDHLEGSFYDRVPVAAMMPNLHHSQHCWTCQSGQHTYQKCPNYSEFYQVEGFTNSAMSLRMLTSFGLRWGASFILFKNSLIRVPTEKRVFRPDKSSPLGVDRKFVFYFSRSTMVKACLDDKDFLKHLDSRFQPVLRFKLSEGVDDEHVSPLSESHARVAPTSESSRRTLNHAAPYKTPASDYARVKALMTQRLARKSQQNRNENTDNKDNEDDDDAKLGNPPPTSGNISVTLVN